MVHDHANASDPKSVTNVVITYLIMLGLGICKTFKMFVMSGVWNYVNFRTYVINCG